MRGRFLDAWQPARAKIWKRLSESSLAPRDLFCELYRELVPAIDGHNEHDDVDLFSNPSLARQRFMRLSKAKLKGEREVRDFFVRAHSTLADIDDALAERYAELLRSFCAELNLRYEVRQPFQIVVTLPGVLAELSKQLRATCHADNDLKARLDEFEESFADLSESRNANRIKTCVQRQMNLVEAVAGKTLGQQGQNLGAACGALQSWPHAALRESARKVYGFASDYPGIRHAGNQNAALRDIDMRDLISVATLLLGYTPYITDAIDAEDVFHGLAA